MSPRAKFEPSAIFASLLQRDVRFVLIGGLAGGARGAGWPTFDVDIVIDDVEENRVRLLEALEEIGAEYDTFHVPAIRADAKRLREMTGPQLFRSRYGRLDVLKEAGGETYETLQRDASNVEQHGHLIRCASLEALLRMKRAANRPKDLPAIVKLEEALRRRDE